MKLVMGFENGTGSMDWVTSWLENYGSGGTGGRMRG